MCSYVKKIVGSFSLIRHFILIMLMAQKIHSYIVPNAANVEQYSPNQEALSLADRSNYHYRNPEGPGTYAFGYDVNDVETGNSQFRDEERHADGSVTGSYGYIDPFGVTNIVHYIADVRGYRATIERKPPNTVWLKSTPNTRRYPLYG